MAKFTHEQRLAFYSQLSKEELIESIIAKDLLMEELEDALIKNTKILDEAIALLKTK